MVEKAFVYQLLDETTVGRLAQLDGEKNVHAIPFVFVRHGDHLYSPIDGKPKKHAKLSRLAWIKSEPYITVLFDHYQDDWSKLWWLRIYGNALEIKSDAQNWSKIASALANKYSQYEHTPMFTGEPTMISIAIEKWRYWAAATS